MIIPFLPFLLQAFARWMRRAACEWRESRRVERDLAELRLMDAHELRDLGITHASMAMARREPCCA
jgi:uncharacterized protein YjiS (DUF1127 family)